MRLDINAPVTQQPAALEAAAEAARRRESGTYGRRLAKNGYVTYLPHPECHSNSAASYAGWGKTPEESFAEACYWANQAPFVVTVPASKAPRWAVDEADEAEAQMAQ